MTFIRARSVSAFLGFIVVSIAACSSEPATEHHEGKAEEALGGPPTPAAPSPPNAYALAHLGMPPGAVPVRVPGAPSNPTRETANLIYHGGPVLQNVKIVSVLWTANVDPNVKEVSGQLHLPEFY